MYLVVNLSHSSIFTYLTTYQYSIFIIYYPLINIVTKLFRPIYPVVQYRILALFYLKLLVLTFLPSFPSPRLCNVT